MRYNNNIVREQLGKYLVVVERFPTENHVIVSVQTADGKRYQCEWGKWSPASTREVLNAFINDVKIGWMDRAWKLL